MYGSLRTSSLKVYFILRYISSPTEEKSMETSFDTGVSRPTYEFVSIKHQVGNQIHSALSPHLGWERVQKQGSMQGAGGVTSNMTFFVS